MAATRRNGGAAAPAGAAALPKLSVVVPVLNGGSDFGRCLDALAASPASPAWELVVVDDGSTDGSADAARAVGARVLQTAHPRSGPAAARNVGATAARGELLLFIDADVVVRPETIRRMVGAFGADPPPAAVFGSYDTRPGVPNFVSQYKNLLHHFVHQVSRPEATTFWSGCGAIRRSVFLELGGFDPDYRRPSIEDIELGCRLTRAGYSVRLRRDIQVGHLKRWTPASLLVSDIRDRGIPWTKLMLRERAFTTDLNLRKENRVSVACVALLWLVLAGAAVRPMLAWGALPLAALLLGLNAALYGFFRRQRGFWFMLAAIPWHWLYYTYNGLCLVVGALALLRPAERRRAGSRPEGPVRLLHDHSPHGVDGQDPVGYGDRANGRGVDRRSARPQGAGYVEVPT